MFMWCGSANCAIVSQHAQTLTSYYWFTLHHYYLQIKKRF